MKYKLVITEKPSVAQAIAKVLGATDRKDGYLTGSGYIVSWCLGHLLNLAEPQAYDPKYRKWRKEDLPIIPGETAGAEEWIYQVAETTKKQFRILKSLMERQDVTGLVNACDAGREGELIFRLVYHHAQCSKPVERLWISSMEDQAIREGFENLKPGSDYDRLYEAAICRERADWIVGINATRLFSCLYGQLLNVGRVVTPTLAMAVRRDAEIKNFKPETFYRVELDLNGLKVTGRRLKDRTEAEQHAGAAMSLKEAEVISAERKERQENPPKLYDLTSLQRDANKTFGFTAQQTLDYVQGLYEKKLVTYPRTDSRYLTDDMEDVAFRRADVVRQRLGLDRQEADISVKVTDSSRVTDHHAIIPTAVFGIADLKDLTAGESAVLSLISYRLAEAMSRPCRYMDTEICVCCADEEYRAKGKEILEEGWKEIDRIFRKKIIGEEAEKDPQAAQTIPELLEGQQLRVVSANITEGKTSPPENYTESSLLSAMERADGMDDHPKQPEEDPAPADVSEDNEEGSETEISPEHKGIGTPATRAGIIEKLVRNGFIERQGTKRTKYLIPTSKGNALVTVMPQEIRSAAMTAEWEHKLGLIERGEYDSESFINGISEFVTDLVARYQAAEGAEYILPGQEPAKILKGKCPVCGNQISERQKGWHCTNQNCRFVIWKDNRLLNRIGKSMNEEIAEQLLKCGSSYLSGCRSAKNGKYFDAVLVMETESEGRARYRLEFGVK